MIAQRLSNICSGSFLRRVVGDTLVWRTSSVHSQAMLLKDHSPFFGRNPQSTFRSSPQITCGGVRVRQFCSAAEREVTSFHVQDYDDFKDRVINCDRPVLADFFADWCGPCKLLGPRLEHIVDGKEGKVYLAKINIDDCGDIAVDYGVEVVPTVIAFKNGEQVEQFTGVQEDEIIQALLNRLLNE